MGQRDLGLFAGEEKGFVFNANKCSSWAEMLVFSCIKPGAGEELGGQWSRGCACPQSPRQCLFWRLHSHPWRSRRESRRCVPCTPAGPIAVGTAAKRKWGFSAASLSGSVPAPARGGSCMDRRVLRGLLSLLPPPLHQVRPRMLNPNPESAPPSKRPRSRLMAPPRIGTHNGTFHCDEALACALLRLLPQYRVQPAKNAGAARLS